MVSISYGCHGSNDVCNQKTNSKSSSINKKTKMSDLLNYRIRVTTQDNRQFVGQMLSFDKHMNLVLSETEEFRITKKSYINLKESSSANKNAILNEEKRSLGLILLRGEQVVSLAVESAPPVDPKTRIGLQAGNGVSKPLKAIKSLNAPVQTKKFVPPPGFTPGFKRN